MGAVWRGHDDTLRRDVALKILSPFKKRNGSANFGLELFMQEARAVAKLQHPGVVSIFEVAEDAGQCFLALELMEGGTLKEYIDRVGPIGPREVFAMMVGPAKALDVAHKRGIIHRDIKPGNLMFDDHGHLKLMDFGLADVAYEEVSSKLRGKAVGSLGWVAPETARGKQTTGSSDIYSFGLVMLYAMTGKQWLIANSRSKMIQLHQSPPTLVLDNIQGLTLDGEALIRKCLAVEPSERFADAAELAAALQANSEEEQIPMMVAPAPVLVEQRRGAPVLTVVGIGLGVVLGVAVAALIFRGSGGKSGDESNGRIEPPPTIVEHAPAPATPTQTTPPRPVVKTEIKKPEPPKPAAQKPEDQPAQVTKTTPTAEVPPKADAPPVEDVADPNRPWIEARPELHPKFLASRNGRVYHVPTCEGGRKTQLRNLRQFESRAEAEAADLKPCPYCHPDQGPEKPD